MKNMALLFLGVFFTIAFSWTGLILSSQLQYGKLEKAALDEDGDLYPQLPVGEALQGKEVYRSQGCMYCHSQQVSRKGYRADYERGWGDRQSVPRDYILQKRVMLGTMRTGSDLMNVGQRLMAPDWHYLHLYDADLTSPGSIMPRYSYLFKEQKIKDEPTADALKFPPNYKDGSKPGYEIVPTDRARQLVAYLLSLKLDYELPESKFVTE